MKTTLVKEAEIERKWYLVDAAGKPAGRLAVEIAALLRGKHKPVYAPHQDLGDFIVVINAAKVALTGTKEDRKIYQHYTGYPSGLKEFTARTIRQKHPERIIRQAVRGMLPKNNLGRRVIKRLKIYPGAEHPHVAQEPEAVELI